MSDASDVFNAVYKAKDNSRYFAYAIFLPLSLILSLVVSGIVALVLSMLLIPAFHIDILDLSSMLALIPIYLLIFLPLFFVLFILTFIPLNYSLLQEALVSAGFKRRIPESYLPTGYVIPLCKLYLLTAIANVVTWLDMRVLAVQLITYLEIVLLILSFLFGQQSLIIPLLGVFLLTLIPFIIAEFYAVTKLMFASAIYLTDASVSETGALSGSWKFTKGRVWELALLNGGIVGGIFAMAQIVLGVLQNIPCVSFFFILIFIPVSFVIGAVGYASVYKMMRG